MLEIRIAQMFADEGLGPDVHRLGTDAIEHRVGLAQRQQQQIDQRIGDADGVVRRQAVALRRTRRCTKSCAIRPVPVRAESLHGDIFAEWKPRSRSSSFGTMTTSCRVSDGLMIVCGQETS